MGKGSGDNPDNVTIADDNNYRNSNCDRNCAPAYNDTFNPRTNDNLNLPRPDDNDGKRALADNNDTCIDRIRYDDRQAIRSV